VITAFFAGSLVVLFAMDHPTMEDFGAVATCTAVGCLAMGFVLLAAVGGGSIGNLGSCASPGNCGGCNNTCGTNTGTSSDPLDSTATVATAGAGVGAAAGLLVGAAYAFFGRANDVDPLTFAVATGSGLLIGGTVGGAIGGGIAGHMAD
jgi:hypothetical protein